MKEAGIRVISSATNVAEAKALEAAGMDAIIAQGYEAGGHRGSHLPTPAGEGIGLMALIPQMVDAVRVPVIAAGGIADGRGIAAALSLGASAVQIGTGFLRCPESSVSQRHRDAIAASSAHDTMFTNAVSGRSARGLKSDYAVGMAKYHGALPSFPSMYALTRPLLGAAAEIRPEPVSFFLFGQSAALTKALPAGEYIDWLVADTQKTLSRLSKAS
ncbi:MAG: nitronate monooxygenase [Boseongicola sp.]